MVGLKEWLIRVRTHDQNFVPLIICNKNVNLLKINVPSCQKNVPPCQRYDPPSQINVLHCQLSVPVSNKLPKFLRQNHDTRDNYLKEGHIFVSLFDHVDGSSSLRLFLIVTMDFRAKMYGYKREKANFRQKSILFEKKKLTRKITRVWAFRSVG